MDHFNRQSDGCVTGPVAGRAGRWGGFWRGFRGSFRVRTRHRRAPDLHRNDRIFPFLCRKIPAIEIGTKIERESEAGIEVQVLLQSPGCDIGCSDCSRSCAIAQIQLAWWMREEERLLRDRPPLADRRFPPWRDEILEAQGHLERLRRDIRAACPPASASRAERPRSPVPVLVWSDGRSAGPAPHPRKTPEACSPPLPARAADCRR